MGQAWVRHVDLLDDEHSYYLVRARAWLKANQAPAKAFPQLDLVANPAWNILLDLYIALIENRHISVSSACIGSGAPSTTALRYISALTEAGLIARIEDIHDKRRVFLQLTLQGRFGVQCAIDAASKAEKTLEYQKTLRSEPVERRL
jgi:hypothetical protein